MRTLILIYMTDPWHSLASRDIIGVATTENHRDRIIRKFLREEKSAKRAEIQEAIGDIQRMDQTQCLSEKYHIEIDTETITANTLI